MKSLVNYRINEEHSLREYLWKAKNQYNFTDIFTKLLNYAKEQNKNQNPNNFPQYDKYFTLDNFKFSSVDFYNQDGDVSEKTVKSLVSENPQCNIYLNKDELVILPKTGEMLIYEIPMGDYKKFCKDIDLDITSGNFSYYMKH